jgi:hypothetical protein
MWLTETKMKFLELLHIVLNTNDDLGYERFKLNLARTVLWIVIKKRADIVEHVHTSVLPAMFG